MKAKASTPRDTGCPQLVKNGYCNDHFGEACLCAPLTSVCVQMTLDGLLAEQKPIAHELLKLGQLTLDGDHLLFSSSLHKEYFWHCHAQRQYSSVEELQVGTLQSFLNFGYIKGGIGHLLRPAWSWFQGGTSCGAWLMLLCFVGPSQVHAYHPVRAELLSLHALAVSAMPCVAYMSRWDGYCQLWVTVQRLPSAR